MAKRSQMRALIMTADTALVGSLTQICRELGIDAEPLSDFQNTFDLVNQRKYDAVFLDADTVNAALPVLTAVRESRSNRGAVAFVIATKTEENAQALARRAHFVFRRPLNIDEVQRACRAAYDFMLDESRRYFRKNASLSVKIADHKTIFESSTLNISANGMAVRTLVPLDLAATVELEFALPDGFRIHASGLVVWHDPEGNSGLRFHCSEPEMRDRLDNWLCSEFQKNEIR